MIVTHNSAPALEQSLKPNVEVARALDAPIVVADNASADATVALLEAAQCDFPALEIVKLERNCGYAAGVNRAAAAVPGADLLLINPDLILLGTTQIQELRTQLAQRPRAAVIGPALSGHDRVRQSSARAFPWLGALLGSLGSAPAAIRAHYERYLEPSDASGATVVDWVIGAAMLLRRATFDDRGGWDERFFLYMEDADYCRRCWRAGWQVWYVPDVEFRHDYQRESSRAGTKVTSSWARRRHLISLARFFAREPGLLRRKAGDRRVALRP